MLNPFKKSYSTKELYMFRFLNKVKLFETLSYKEMSYFLPFLYLREYSEGEAVFFRDDPSNALYIVKTGVVSLNIEMADKFEVLTHVKSGQAFGDNSLLDNTKRIYTSIVVSEKAHIYVLPKVSIKEIFENHSVTRAKVLTSFAETYNQYTKNLFKAYKSSFGFFDLGQAYLIPED